MPLQTKKLLIDRITVHLYDLENDPNLRFIDDDASKALKKSYRLLIDLKQYLQNERSGRKR